MRSSFGASLELKNGGILQVVSCEKYLDSQEDFILVTSVVSSERVAGAAFCKLQH